MGTALDIPFGSAPWRNSWRATGMTAARARHVRLAGVFHDLGHMGVPNRITAKPNNLSVEEMDEMQAHPWYVLDILSHVPGMSEIAVWAAAHHERMDGRGYPNMLTDAEIPLGARVIAIADMFDALTADRPHRNALSIREAFAVMDNAAGTQFDVERYQRFREMVEGARAPVSAPRSLQAAQAGPMSLT